MWSKVQDFWPPPLSPCQGLKDLNMHFRRLPNMTYGGQPAGEIAGRLTGGESAAGSVGLERHWTLSAPQLLTGPPLPAAVLEEKKRKHCHLPLVANLATRPTGTSRPQGILAFGTVHFIIEINATQSKNRARHFSVNHLLMVRSSGRELEQLQIFR